MKGHTPRPYYRLLNEIKEVEILSDFCFLLVLALRHHSLSVSVKYIVEVPLSFDLLIFELGGLKRVLELSQAVIQLPTIIGLGFRCP
jgi:hypothetical protein